MPVEYGDEGILLLPILCTRISLLDEEIRKVRGNIARRLEALNHMSLQGMSEELIRYMERERENLENMDSELEYVAKVINYIREKTCNEKPSHASLLESINVMDKLYLRYIMSDSRSLPGHIVSLLYNIQYILKKVYDGSTA